MKRSTIQDVAKACGVAKSTVSVVLNSTPAADRVPEETRARVRQAAEQLGYRPSWRARVLAEQKTHMIGVLYTPPMPIVTRGNYESILVGINRVLREHDYQLLFMPLGDNPVEWRKMLLEQRIDGAIVLSRLLPQLAEIILAINLPVALVNAQSDQNVAQVLADDYDGSKQSVLHLLKLGHKNITFILGRQPPHYSVDQRVAAYKDEMTAAGHQEQIRVLEESVEQFAGEFDRASGRPTAVMCYTHYIAIKLLQLLWKRGFRVPEDLSIACFSNAYPVEDVIPPLTTVALATDQMGQVAAEQVLEQIQTRGAAPRKKIVLETKLIVRESTGSPRS